MKKYIYKAVFLFSSLFITQQSINAQCHIDDWTALKAFYESTDGDNWYDFFGLENSHPNWEEVTGNSPTVLCNLENLRGVDLDENGRVSRLYFSKTFLNGNIPSELGNLSNLTYLRLDFTGISGNIPPELGNLNNLTSLNLGSNGLSGNIPHELGNLSNLTRLDLASNQLNGNIPPELGNLNNLTNLDLQQNQLSGNIPPELSNLSNLTNLNLSYNGLIGNIPTELGNLNNLTNLHLSYNNLSGNIPSELGNLSDLTYLSLSSNILSGNIPIELSNLINLTNLYLGGNILSGNIPTELSNLINLISLYLSFNNLSGNIPPELGNLSDLTYLSLSSNNLSGNIPPQLGNLNNLTGLYINDNNLSGCYPNSIIPFCTQLTSPSFDGNPDISNGNNFTTTWENFCNTGDGICIVIEVWPGDLNYDGICNNIDRSISYIYFGESGPYRTPGGIAWEAQACQGWSTLQNNGHNIKHHDCDGNGNINSQDVNAINLNYGKTHPMPSGIISTSHTLYTNTDFQILLQPINQVSPNSNTIIMNVVLDSKSGQNLEVFGGHFSIDYSNIVADVDNAVMNFESLSWLGIPNVDLLAESWHNTFENTIEVGFTKTDGVASIGKGIIGRAVFSLNTNLNRNNNCENLLDVAITKIGSFNAQQDTLQIEEEFRTINLGISCCEPFINIDDETPFQNLYQSSSAIATNGYLPIGESQQVQYNANRVTLNEGFSAKAGADFKVRSSGCN